MRLFLAVLLPPSLHDRVIETQQILRPKIGDDGVKWTRPDQFHYTLKFLGEQLPPRVRSAEEATARIGQALKPFVLTPEGVGAFPSADRPSTLWVGATEGGDMLCNLALELDEALFRNRFPRESRKVTAHLTLARIKSYRGEAAAARALRTCELPEIGSFTVDRVVLMRSTLLPTGSVYDAVEEFPLTG